MVAYNSIDIGDVEFMSPIKYVDKILNENGDLAAEIAQRVRSG